MPLYTWEDKKTGKTIDVLRSVADIEDIPTKEEMKAELKHPREDSLTLEEFEAANFHRITGSGIRTVRGGSWGAGKGYWDKV
jgi:hypothetical protein